MRAYQFNPKTKEYEQEVDCQLDPLETKKQGKKIFLLPANSTKEKPLPQKKGYKVIFSDGWVYDKIPEPEPKPEPTEEEIKQQMRRERDTLLSGLSWRLERYSEQLQLGIPTADDAETIQKIIRYRQYLRDYPSSLNWFKTKPKSFEEWAE